MLQIRAILRKFGAINQSIKIGLFKVPSFATLGKIFSNKSNEKLNFPNNGGKNILTIHCVRHAESTVNALKNEKIKKLDFYEIFSGKDPGKLCPKIEWILQRAPGICK
ncbi:Histidine phosphatase superfamily (branch 1) family protein [Cryptosporidium felis]|nr:Histidine phosphatase superfamily (branch 1) family protein [Cryptosporidium felis]